MPNWHSFCNLQGIARGDITIPIENDEGPPCSRSRSSWIQGRDEFYVRTLTVLNEAGIPYLIGGAYAMGTLAGIERHTKDIDIFVRRRDRDADPAHPGSGRLPDRGDVPALARQGLGRRAVRRRDLLLRQRRRPGRRRVVRACRGRRAAGHPGAALPARGDHLVQGVRAGARAVRRRRHRPPDPQERPELRLAAPAPPLRRTTGASCWPTSSTSASSIRASGMSSPNGSSASSPTACSASPSNPRPRGRSAEVRSSRANSTWSTSRPVGLSGWPAPAAREHEPRGGQPLDGRHRAPIVR